MAIAARTAETTWEGSLASGSGLIRMDSGATSELPVTWASRTERLDEKTTRRSWRPPLTRPATRWRWRCGSASTRPSRNG
jgi:hypothetical protein